MPNIIFHPANQRGHADHGWLDTYHSFSFASYHDPQKVHFGMLRVLNDDLVKGGFGFGKHPHDNMEIITVVLEGALEHKDTMGHTEAIHPDEVQVMSAGSGLQHSEYNHNKDVDVKLFQIWIFPKVRGVQPRYEQRVFPASGRLNAVQMLVSPMDTKDEGLKIHQDAWIYRTTLTTGKAINHKLHHPANGIYIMNIEGNIIAAGQKLGRRDAVGISGDGEVTVSANEDSDVLIIEVPMVG